MKYILLTHDKLKFIIDDKNYAEFLQAIKKNDKAFILKKYKAVIPLHITPTIIPFEVWFAQENERLALTHHRLCNKCFCIIQIADGCKCWNGTKDQARNAFGYALPEKIKLAIDKIAASKIFPTALIEETAKIQKIIDQDTNGSPDYYFNEDGEKIYL